MILYSRKAILQIDSIVVEFGAEGGLDFEFEVIRTATPEANSARVAVYNLARDTRHQIAEAAAGDKKVYTRIEAGYVDATTVVFDGEFDFCNISRSGADVVTELTLRDGAKTMATAGASVAFRKGAQVSDVIKALAEASQFAFGNLQDAVAKAQVEGVGTVFPYPIAVNGNAYAALQRVAKAAGLEVSVQGGKLQLVAIGGALNKRAVILTSDTGLIGSPSMASAKKGAQPGQAVTAPAGLDGSVLKARALIMPGLDPGQQIQVKSENVDGAFVIRRVRYTGSTFGKEWYADIEAKPL